MTLQQIPLFSRKEYHQESVYSILFASLPPTLLVCALIFLGLQRPRPKLKALPFPYIKGKSSLINVYVQALLVTTKGLYHGRAVFSNLNDCGTQRHFGGLLTSFGLLAILAMSSPVTDHNAAQSISCMIVVSAGVFIDALYHFFAAPASNGDQFQHFAHLAVAFLIFTLASLIPYPLSHDNVKPLDYGIAQLIDNQFYRDGCQLIPKATASFLSRISMSWFIQCIVTIHKKAITSNGLYTMSSERLTKVAYAEYDGVSRLDSCRKLWKQLYMANRKYIWISTLVSTLVLALRYIDVFLRQQLLRYIDDSDGRPLRIAYGFAFGSFFVSISTSFIRIVEWDTLHTLNQRIEGMLTYAVYDKFLRQKTAPGDALKDDEDGECPGEQTNQPTISDKNVMDILEDDVESIANVDGLQRAIFSPIEIILVVTYLYSEMGTSALVGTVAMALLLPIGWIFDRKTADISEETRNASNRRIRLVEELLNGIRLIKYFGWEASWREKVLQARNKENYLRLKAFLYTVVLDTGVLAIPLCVSAVSLIWYTKVLGNKLTTDVTFITINLFERLQHPLVDTFDMASTYRKTKVSIERVSRFLNDPRVDKKCDIHISAPEGVKQEDAMARVGFEESEFQWHTVSSSSSVNANSPFRLHVPVFDFPIGCLSIVCGPTGGGKSSLLSALLGEMKTVSGHAYLPSKRCVSTPVGHVDPNHPDLYLDKVAYVCQHPFLQNDTVRNNILFGEPFEPARYNKVIFQCALAVDFSLWSDRDLTNIGVRGITLSGGQKQRVSLARAVYSRAKTVLIDDCLSSVDSHTARHIYEECINGDLLSGRTVILTTHHINLCLPKAKFLVKVDCGRVVWNDVIEKTRHTKELETLVGYNPKSCDDAYADDQIDQKNIGSFETLTIDERPSSVQVEESDEKIKSHIGAEVLLYYITMCGGWASLFVIALTSTLGGAMSFYEDWWLRIWSLPGSEAPNNTYAVLKVLIHAVNKMCFLVSSYLSVLFSRSYALTTISPGHEWQDAIYSWIHGFGTKQGKASVDYYITIYIAICISNVLFRVLESCTLKWATWKGSVSLFERLLRRVTRAPIRFFDLTPPGEIQLRMVGSISTVDSSLAEILTLLGREIVKIASAGLVIFTISPEFAALCLTIGIAQAAVGRIHALTSKKLSDMGYLHFSQFDRHISEMLDGVTTIRAYTQQERFMSIFCKLRDVSLASNFLYTASSRWLSIVTNLVNAVMVLSASVFILWKLDDMDAGLARIFIVYVGILTCSLSNSFQFYSCTLSSFNHVKRAQEYMRIEQEPPAIIQDQRPPASWPISPSIQVRDLEVRYSPDLDPVLHSITFDVRSREKIGVVGRTGSGKSTLALSFFRFVDATHGSITIDGINIYDIGIHDLRTKLTIIPQDALLFSGTIRYNLDPLEEHNDAELWESLRRVSLVQPLENTRDIHTNDTLTVPTPNYPVTSLDQVVCKGGNNFSQGERQLLCMARALLRNSRVVILDEATASVDFDMDVRVQKTIREEFVDTTVICIAHRLRTVTDYDRILVLSQGRIVEYDTPQNLLSRPSTFKSMCEQAGELGTL